MQITTDPDEGNLPAIGALLIGHGTRDSEGVAEFHSTVRQVALARPDLVIEPCFLEIAEPTIQTAVVRLVERGVQQIIAMPLLLFAAGHAKRDVPLAVAAALASHTQIDWRQAGHLGCHPAILEQSVNRFREALADRHTVSKEQTAILFVGRGSHDRGATQEMHQFASMALQSLMVDRVEVAFFAMAQPSLEDKLEQIAEYRYERVVIQPHLLFGGVLLGKIRELVELCANRHPATDWVMADRLGPTPPIVRAIAERMDAEMTLAKKSPPRSACRN